MDCADPGCDGGARATRARSVGAAPRAAPRRRNHDAGGGQRGDAGDRFAAAAGVAWLLAEPRRCGLSRQARLEFARGCHRERARLSAAADAADRGFDEPCIREALCAAGDAFDPRRAGAGDDAADPAAHRLPRLHRSDLRARGRRSGDDSDHRRRRDRSGRPRAFRRLAAGDPQADRLARDVPDRRRPGADRGALSRRCAARQRAFLRDYDRRRRLCRAADGVARRRPGGDRDRGERRPGGRAAIWPRGGGGVSPGVGGRCDGWRQALPKPIGSPATYQIADGRGRIAVPYPADAPLGNAHFFAITTGVVAYAAPQTVSRDGDRVVIETGASGGEAAGSLDGVLRIAPDRGLSLTAAPGVVASVDAGSIGVRAALLAFFGALLGGLILNIMPCVFPILSLKALSLARAGIDERHARREGVAYTAGVVLTCVALGAIILALRAGGSAIGWAFQLQDPRMIVVLFVLALAIALNLAGLFQIPTPRFVNRAAGSGGAFLTGVLAAFVATPCTGPFMGAELGAALVSPGWAAPAGFAGRGAGLGLNFLSSGFVTGE